MVEDLIADDDDAGRGKIDSWEALKKELKNQILPCNTIYVARDLLKSWSTLELCVIMSSYLFIFYAEHVKRK